MKYVFYQLLKPFEYLRIKNNKGLLLQISFPLICAGIVFFIIKDNNIDDLKKFLSRILDFLFVLAPFSLAALAAVATFPTKSLNSLPAGKNKPYLIRLYKGNPEKEQLTRKRMLSFLFGYITAASMLAIVIGLIAPEASFLSSLPYPNLIKKALLFLYLFLFCNIIINTFWGLFYLTDRIHRNEDQ